MLHNEKSYLINSRSDQQTKLLKENERRGFSRERVVGQGGQRATANLCDRFQGQGGRQGGRQAGGCRSTENRRSAGAFSQGIQRVGALVHQHAPEPSSFPAGESRLETPNEPDHPASNSSPCTPR